MKRAITIAAMLAAAGLAGAQMFAQLFGGSAETPIPAVAWYKLDGNALDSSGNGYDGTVTAGATSTNGVFGQAYYTGGTGGITLPVGLTPHSSSGVVTVCLWMNSFHTPGSPVNYVCRGYEHDAWAEGNRFHLGYIWGYIVIRLGTDGPNTSNRIYNKRDRYNEWHHVACTVDYDANTLSAWHDGVLVIDQREAFFGDKTASAPIYIGKDAVPWGADDVRIYSRALSTANIQRIMTGQDVSPIEELQ